MIITNYLPALIGVAVKDTANSAGGLGFDSRALKSNTVSSTARHRCDVSLELCCPGAMPGRWTPPLVTRFDVRNTASMNKI